MTTQSNSTSQLTSSAHPCLHGWCTDEIRSGPENVLHSHDLPQTWGGDGPFAEKLRLSLEQQDDEDGEGEPQLCVQYLPNGRVAQGTVGVPLNDSPDLVMTMLRLIAEGTGRSTATLLAELLSSELQRPAT